MSIFMHKNSPMDPNTLSISINELDNKYIWAINLNLKTSKSLKKLLSHLL
jgi:hypothetical protein